MFDERDAELGAEFDSEVKRPVRPHDGRSHGRRWCAFLLAFIAVVGLAARYAEAQSRTPKVDAISFANSPVRGDTYELGEKIKVIVRFNRSVEWSSGRTELAVAVGGRIRHAQAHSITFDGRELRFFYTVRADDRDADGISIPVGALAFDHGTITDTAGKNVTDMTNEVVPADAGRKVDGSRVTAPRISNIIYHGPSRGRTYRRDDRIEVMVEFDRAVRVTGVPQMALTIGTETRWSNFLPIDPLRDFMDPESSIRFCYTVRQEDRDSDGISIPANALSLNGGTITLADDAETEAVLIHAAVVTHYYGRVNGRPSAVDDLLRAAARLRNRARELATDILLNFVSRVSWREYPVDPDPCPQSN